MSGPAEHGCGPSCTNDDRCDDWVRHQRERGEESELAAARTEIASLRMALGCARQNATFALGALKVPSMDGGNLAKARGWLETIRADVAAELARGGR
jgi:hypothetical protein